MHRELSLFTWSKLEHGRVKPQQPDPKRIEGFAEIETMVAHSISPPILVEKKTQAGTPLREPRILTRPLEDDRLLNKLLQFRDRIPLSSRIIRTGQT
jgi:hypothetical protein